MGIGWENKLSRPTNRQSEEIKTIVLSWGSLQIYSPRIFLIQITGDYPFYWREYLIPFHHNPKAASPGIRTRIWRARILHYLTIPSPATSSMLRSGSCVIMRRILPPQCRNIKSSLSPGALNALSESSTKYFKPHRRQLARLSDRHQVQNYTTGLTFIRDYYEMTPWLLQKLTDIWPQGWRIRAGSYFLIPFRQAFSVDFPQDWTIFLSFKTDSASQVRVKYLYTFFTVSSSA